MENNISGNIAGNLMKTMQGNYPMPSLGGYIKDIPSCPNCGYCKSCGRSNGPLKQTVPNRYEGMC